MTYPFEIRDRYVELRASGVSVKYATEQLGIAYNTGVNWEPAIRDEVEVRKAIHREELLEKYRISKEGRIEIFGEIFLATKDELKKRDLSQVATPKLLDMMISCVKVLKSELEEPVVLSETEIERKRDERILAHNIQSAEVMELRKNVMKLNKPAELGKKLKPTSGVFTNRQQ
jgi:hypothetical protein